MANKDIEKELQEQQKAQAEEAKAQTEERKQDDAETAALREQLKAEILAELRAEQEMAAINIKDEDGNKFSNEMQEGGRFKIGDVFVDSSGKQID